MQLIILIFCALALINCSTSSKGFVREDLKQQIGVNKPVTTDADIKAAMAKKPNLPKPFKLAVYFKSPKHNGSEKAPWRWTQADKDQVFAATKELENQKMISKVFPLVRSVVPNENLHSLRLAAAQHGADALLVVGGVSDLDRYINNWGYTYSLIIPTLFVPGSEADSLFIANASLWDVRNEYLYLTAESESETNDTYIPAWGDSDKELIGKAKQSAVNDLKTQVVKMIKGT